MDNDQRCNKTWQLHDIYLKDPNSPSSSLLLNLCKTHYDFLTDETTHRIRDFQRKILNLEAEKARLRHTAKEYDTYYDGTKIQQKIDDLKVLSRKIQGGECKNYYCMQDLTKLERESKLYSAHTFKPSGRRQFSFYFCSLKCFNIFKAKCGLQVPILKGQHILNS